MIDQQKLDEWKRLAADVTPGPWVVDDSEMISVSSMNRDAIYDVGNESSDGTLEDAVFIAASREAVPELIAEVERLQKKVMELESTKTLCEQLLNAGME